MADGVRWWKRFTILVPGTWLAAAALCGLMLVLRIGPTSGDGWIEIPWSFGGLLLLVRPVIVLLDGAGAVTIPLVVAFTISAWLPTLALIGWLLDRIHGRAPLPRRKTAWRLLAALLIANAISLALLSAELAGA